ncbi:RagB/SusD family nutrient uptake outer membrane protein [uncultured Duncaniella sp.]|uniref:RagB/SusD family nutrient uptake outer membrane protein n=1 Tax=uncultured Duncaniella sp. TaxID=2768039 RepID=UPI002600C6A1|nr:RagB/SusD family nutrient uptake outer membrane protein [uncultured Duncaniella sp.]
MKLKNIAFFAIACSAILSSCESFTDVDQKGMNLLSKTSDLELLLNANYYGDWKDLTIICGDALPMDYIPTSIEEPNKSFTQILLAWDENEHATRLPALATDDEFYTDCFSYIGTVANPVLMRVDEAIGPEDHKNKLRAEALTIRAYYEWLVAQKYAAAYDPATAETERCIPYLFETHDIQIPSEQLTQKQVYTNILADLDRAIGLDCLPVAALNRERVCKSFVYAVKAHVLMSMGDQTEAEKAARKALEFGSTVTDYKNLIVSKVNRGGTPIEVLVLGPKFQMEEDYFTNNTQCNGMLITPYNDSMFEPGHYRKDNLSTGYLSSKGSYDPDDPEKDLEAIKNDYIRYYGVPYNSVSDLDSQHNTCGIKTSHMYMILAECAIDRGAIDEAMGYLDKVRVCRINPDVYQPLEGRVTTKEEAIKYLKKSCHGEYVYTMWNFFTRKRWTRKADYKETLTRELLGKTYTITPESPLWIFPFPRNVMEMNPNIQHNYPTR